MHNDTVNMCIRALKTQLNTSRNLFFHCCYQWPLLPIAMRWMQRFSFKTDVFNSARNYPWINQIS